jgi:hypothetical protein
MLADPELFLMGDANPLYPVAIHAFLLVEPRYQMMTDKQYSSVRDYVSAPYLNKQKEYALSIAILTS